MKDKKGFTLIELLAIIVILAIIAVITVPIILNIIETAKRGAATDSAYGYKDAIQQFYASELSRNPNYQIADGIHTKQEFDNMGVEVSGKEPESNSFLRTYKSMVTQGCLQFDEYKVEILDGKPQQAEKGTCKQVEVVYTDVNNNSKIDKGDTVKIEGEEFYILGYPENGKLKLIPKYNLNSEPKQASSNYINNKYIDDAQQAYWAYSAGAGRYVSQEYVNNNYYVYTRDNQNHLYSYFENYKNYLISLGATFITDVRAMSYEDALATGCKLYNNDGYQNSCPGFLSDNFWLGTANDGRLMYSISSGGYIDITWSDGNKAYRPLVEIYESAITNEYTIKYVTRTETVISDQKITVGSKIGTFPTEPTKTNATFEGWYTDPEYTTKVTTETVPIGSATYYARYVLSKVEYTDIGNDGINTGDIVKIMDDEFWVIGTPINGKVNLITKYNLNYSSRQSSTNYINNKFVDDAQQAYWAYSAGAGRYMSQEYRDKNGYVYDTNSNLYYYFNNYKTYLNTQGAEFITDVRALSYEEATSLGCIQYNASGYENSCSTYITGDYWLGTANDGRLMYSISSGGYMELTWSDGKKNYRPLVEISESAFPTN